MLVNRFKFYATTFVITLTLLLLLDNPIMAGVITITVVMVGYIAIGYGRSKKRLNLLEKACDPEAFMAATEAQRKITGKDAKINAYLNVDRAAGLISLGRLQEGKDLLLSIDKSKLSVKNGSLLAFTHNLIVCLYEMGETSEAEKLFETQMPILSPVSKKMISTTELLIAERFFYLNRYEEAKEKYQGLKTEKLSKRLKLHISFRLGEIALIDGDKETALAQFQIVADEGNKLEIAQSARERIERIA